MSVPTLSRDGQTTTDFRAALEAQRDRKRIEWDDVLDRERRLGLEKEELRRYIESLNHTLRAEGVEPIDTAPRAALPARTVGTPGNRREDMPRRRELFTAMTLPDAVVTILEQGGEWHADDVVRSIFVIETAEDLKAAKASLASTLARKAKEGLWERAPGKANTFRAAGASQAGTRNGMN